VTPDLDALADRARALDALACGHPVFGALTSLPAVRVFMEHHVWAVWDFMSLLKSIQAEVAPVTVPWRPPADVESARLINDIVVAEEGDDGFDGQPISHFQVYLSAMKAAGASTAAIERFTAAVDAGAAVPGALADSRAPAASRAFVETTFAIVAGPLPGRVAAFTLGREGVIPRMFGGLLAGLGRPEELRAFSWYLDRHVAIDGERHGPMARRLYERTCLRDPVTHAASLDAACRVLEHRVALWDAVLRALA
jgi:hypothetical protein